MYIRIPIPYHFNSDQQESSGIGNTVNLEEAANTVDLGGTGCSDDQHGQQVEKKVISSII